MSMAAKKYNCVVLFLNKSVGSLFILQKLK